MFAGLRREHLREDLSAGLVVFLVAVPLCIGIASASDAPPFAGLLAGIIGGLVVGALSGAQLSVSGPAAGLVVIVAAAIHELGYPAFLAAVALSGVLQLVLGALRAGGLAFFFPSAVVKGMLAAIGLILILKQAPHAVGYDRDYEGDSSFAQGDGENSFEALASMLGAVEPGAIAVSLLGCAVIVLWPRLQRFPRAPWLGLIPAALVVVVVGALANLALLHALPAHALGAGHLVALPAFRSLGDLGSVLVAPDLAALTDLRVWRAGVTLAIVGSLETLLSLEAVDRLDPAHRISPPNRELLAQGVGNLLCGLLGALPVTSVIVRSSANVQGGGRTKLATIVHGLLLLLGALFGAALLNQIPLAALAVVLIAVGLKLVKPALFKEVAARGASSLVPFLTTMVAVVTTDLLTGTLIGLAVGLVFVLHANAQGCVRITRDGQAFLITLAKDVSFLHKRAVKQAFEGVPDGAHVIIDGIRPSFVDPDVAEAIVDFEQESATRGIVVERRRSPSANNLLFRGART
jgi:MFS superfamily sulfate permease-like transporter